MAETNELDYSRKVADGERLGLIMRQVASRFKLDGNVLAEALLDIHERLKAVEGATEELTSSDRWKAFKTVQLVKPSPSASGDTVTAIDTVAQDENGELTATKKNIRQGTTSQTGIVQLSDATNSTSTALAATANAVKTAYDLANSKYSLPSTGIPKSDLASAVRTSLNKADTAVQPEDISGKAEVFTAIVTSTSWADIAAAFNAGKVLFAYIGGTVSGGSSVFRQSVPLSYVVYESDGTTPCAFIFLFENSTPKTASGEGVGSTTRWTVSSSGWSKSFLNVDYAVAAGTANAANSAATLSQTLGVSLGGTGATSATAAEYNLLTKTTTQLPAVSGSDHILFAYGKPSASSGRICGYRTVDTVGAYILTLMSSYREYKAISFMQQICYAPTSPGTGRGNVHMFAGGKWHNLVNISDNDAGNVKIASMPSDVTSWTDVTNPPSSMFVAKGLCITRQGYVGTLHGFLVPNPNTEDYLPTRKSNTATTYTQSGYKAAACTHLRIDGFDEDIVGGGMAIFTGGLILYVQVSGGTLQAATTSSFGNFTDGAEYFFSIPISFGSIK